MMDAVVVIGWCIGLPLALKAFIAFDEWKTERKYNKKQEVK